MPINLDQPRWDQNSYMGRAQHFLSTTNPMNLFATPFQLQQAKETIEKYKSGDATKLTEDEIWAAKHLYDSAYHPDTGELMFPPGRMSAQVPCNMLITGCMMTFYKSVPAVVFWQWFNQSFNAVVNYTNRSGDTPIPMSTLGTSYVAATGGALGTALGLNAMVKSLPPLVGRFVPFAAVAAANVINIPLMRRSELENGITLMTESGEKVGNSKIAAKEGISMVVMSRILMAAPGMVLIPLVMNSLEMKGTFKRRPWLNAPLQISLLGLILTFATPLCCAIFKQQATIKPTALEPELQQKIKEMANPPELLYYNKGL
jgi:tricarboxylate carrier